MNRNIKNKTTDEGLSEPSHKTDVSRRFMVGKFKIGKIKFTFVFTVPINTLNFKLTEFEVYIHKSLEQII